MENLVTELIEKKIEKRVFASWNAFKKDPHSIDITKLLEEEDIQIILNTDTDPTKLVHIYLNGLAKSQQKLYDTQKKVFLSMLEKIAQVDGVAEYFVKKILQDLGFYSEQLFNKEKVPVSSFDDDIRKIKNRTEPSVTEYSFYIETKKESLFIPFDFINLNDYKIVNLKEPEGFYSRKNNMVTAIQMFIREKLQGQYYIPDLHFIRKMLEIKNPITITDCIEPLIIPGTFVVENRDAKPLSVNFVTKQIAIADSIKKEDMKLLLFKKEQ